MNWLEKTEERISHFLEVTISLFFIIILTTTIAMVILRYIFNTGIYGGNELISYLFIFSNGKGCPQSGGINEKIAD